MNYKEHRIVIFLGKIYSQFLDYFLDTFKNTFFTDGLCLWKLIPLLHLWYIQSYLTLIPRAKCHPAMNALHLFVVVVVCYCRVQCNLFLGIFLSHYVCLSVLNYFRRHLQGRCLKILSADAAVHRIVSQFIFTPLSGSVFNIFQDRSLPPLSGCKKGATATMKLSGMRDSAHSVLDYKRKYP